MPWFYLVRILRACLAALLKHKTTNFKQHNAHFHTFFSSIRISKTLKLIYCTGPKIFNRAVELEA